MAAVLLAVAVSATPAGPAQAATTYDEVAIGSTANTYDLASTDELVGDTVDSTDQAHAYVWVPGDPSPELITDGVFEAVNNIGMAVGSYTDDAQGGASRAICYQVGQPGVTFLDSLGAPGASADDVNDSDQIVGAAAFPGQDDVLHPVMWSPDGSVTDLGLPPASRSGGASFINDAGQVAGASTVIGGPEIVSHALFWTQAGGMIDASDAAGIPATDSSTALALNAHGQEVIEDSTAHTYWLWTPGVSGAVQIKGPPHSSITDVTPSGNPLSDDDTVIGAYSPKTGPEAGYLEPDTWTQAAGPSGIPIPAGSAGQPLGINAADVVVGIFQTQGASSDDLFTWSSEAGVQDLGTPIGETFIDSGPLIGANGTLAADWLDSSQDTDTYVYRPDGVPDAPSDLAVAPGTNAAAVSFTAPDDHGSPITSYAVTAYDQTTAANGGQTTSGGASPIDVTGLTPGDTYVFSIAAISSAGTGPSAFSTAGAVGSLPAAPSQVAATHGVASAVVSFTSPADTVPPISTYTVTAADLTTPANGGQTISGDSSPITVYGLTAGDKYRFTVTATNGVGTGPASKPSRAVVPTAAEPDGSGKMTITPTTVPKGSNDEYTFTFTANAPGGIGAGAVTITVPAGWTAPSSGDVDPGAVTASAGTISVSGQTITVGGLNLARHGTLTIIYGFQDDGGPGATSPPTTGNQMFAATERSTPSGVLTPLATSPKVKVTRD